MVIGNVALWIGNWDQELGIDSIGNRRSGFGD